MPSPMTLSMREIALACGGALIVVVMVAVVVEERLGLMWLLMSLRVEDDGAGLSLYVRNGRHGRASRGARSDDGADGAAGVERVELAAAADVVIGSDGVKSDRSRIIASLVATVANAS